ncbi:hypothetical protein CTAYLR_010258 [Chrysophaeum taylorii]|uniref:Sugar phosphate transporter domain-containing protein n=1 Tax=Chrysophaeum taylorii TaxID=2483200 RepID=A0AAD7UHJ5_9STRA|nr:hypothetical protein CTAYLR_010258 [Chrysophaeum taylorii]
MQRRRAEVEMRLKYGKSKKGRLKGPKSEWPVSGSKVAALAANFIGAVGCILTNKLVMSHGFDMPLMLTLLGYSLVSLVVLASRAARRRRDRVAEKLLPFHHNGELLPPGPSSSKFRRLALVCFTAIAPALANASLQRNSVGFTQLSKVLTTPCIAALERARGVGVPLTRRRLFWLVALHVGVLLASVADVTANRTGTLLALLNVLVTAHYKVEWSAMCRERLELHARGTKPSPAHELLALRDVFERTLPQATACLAPLAIAVEGRRAIAVARAMDASGLATVALAALLGAWTNFSGYHVIGRLSALTHQILGQFKMCCLVYASWWIFGAPLNTTQLCGAGLTVFSITAYTRATLHQRRKLDGYDGPLAPDDDNDVRYVDRSQRAATNGGGDSGGGGGVFSFFTKRRARSNKVRATFVA